MESEINKLKGLNEELCRDDKHGIILRSGFQSVALYYDLDSKEERDVELEHVELILGKLEQMAKKADMDMEKGWFTKGTAGGFNESWQQRVFLKLSNLSVYSVAPEPLKMMKAYMDYAIEKAGGF